MRQRTLTLILGLALVAAACGGAATQADSDPAPAPEGTAAPATTFALFDGTTATLADYQGRPVVVNFWASWCPSCVAEMSAAFKPAQERLGGDVAFLGINVQDTRDKALRLIDETGVLFDVAEDPDGELYLALEGLGMPFTVFIDADGSIVQEHNGPLSEHQLIDLIEERLLS